MRIATISCPILGGTHTVFLSLRRAVQPHGVDLRWLAAGKSIARQARESGTPYDLATGTLIADDTDDEIVKAHALIDYISSTNPDVVIFHVLSGPIEANVARYLPTGTRRLLMVHNITPATYAAARAIRDWVHAAVGVSPRIASDLVRRFGFSPAWTYAIHNAIDVPQFSIVGRGAAHGRALRVLSFGRVEHASKGVLWLPKIFGRALESCVDLTLTVAGDGPDLEELKAAFERRGLTRRVRFVGATPRCAVPQLLSEHDVFLFPSVFEGFGLTLVEAMAAGCVPVASLIRGVTDTIVEDGVSGQLFKVGDTNRAAALLVDLYRDRDRLTKLSLGARTAASTFDLPEYGRRYSELLYRIVASHREIRPPLSMEDWHIPLRLQPSWRRFVPTGLKHLLRLARERF